MNYTPFNKPIALRFPTQRAFNGDRQRERERVETKARIPLWSSPLSAPVGGCESHSQFEITYEIIDVREIAARGRSPYAAGGNKEVKRLRNGTGISGIFITLIVEPG